MNKSRKVFLTILSLVFAVALVTVVIKSNKYVNLTVPTNAEAKSESENLNNLINLTFPQINDLAKNYKANPTYQNARDLTAAAFDGISILDIPESEKSQFFDQVALAHSNGSSNIPESNIVATVNDLASRANAPNFAYTDESQVRVVRKYLNRIVPDLVSANGGMSDSEAFIVFTGVLSQKIDNEDFMVPPGQFSENTSNVTGAEIPGLPQHNGEVTISQESPQTYQMIEAINNYAGSKNALPSNDVITSIGIQ